MDTQTLQAAPAAESREKLRELFARESRALYDYALEKTGSPERAKQVLEQTLREAVRTPSLCMSRPKFLFEMCDHVLLTSRPAHLVLEQMEQSLDLPAEPAAKAQSPVGAVRRMSARPQPGAGYDLDGDEWLNNLRREKRAGRRSESGPGDPAARPGESEMDQDQALEELFDDMGQSRPGVPVRRLTWFLALLVAALLWCAIGLMMNVRVLPWVDLGYKWFNTHVYDMF